MALMAAESLRAQQLDTRKVTKVKAAYLYHFAKFATWPEGTFATAESPIVIGIVGPSVIADALERAVAGKTVHQRPILVRRIAKVSDGAASKLRGCHMLFVCACERDRIEQLWRLLEGSPVLVVSDMEGFARRGGMIGLTLSGTRIVFEIHRGAVRRSGVHLSAKLLKLAKIVG